MARRELRMSPTYFHLLLAVSEGPRHGYAMMQEIEARTRGRIRLGPSSLYHSLGSLADAGLIEEAEGAAGDEGPHEERRRYWRITGKGRERLAGESEVLADVLAHARALGFGGGR